MAAPRLPFLWPMLFKGTEISNPTVRSARAAVRNQAFHSSSRRRLPDAVPQQQRYGTANEPPPHLATKKEKAPGKAMQAKEQTKSLPKIGQSLQEIGEAENKLKQDAQKASEPQQTEPTTADGGVASTGKTNAGVDAGGSTPQENPPQPASAPLDHPLESLLETVPDPTEHAEELQKDQSTTSAKAEPSAGVGFEQLGPSTKPPHINTPRHVHHFDTYGFMRKLVDAGWSQAQAITIMKGMRVMLAENMDVARAALVSKSQVENETYLFRAACAELKTEVTSRRKAEQEKMRTERTQLQLEVDILSQRVGQESGALKDELKGMFDDRKMAVRNEQRTMESKIQRLNYQITVDLQADAKSEVEGLRWVMTRRVIIALASVIFMVVGSLKLYSNAIHEQELDAKRKAKMKSGGTQTVMSSTSTGSGPAGLNGTEQDFGGGLSRIKEGDNPAYVTLG